MPENRLLKRPRDPAQLAKLMIDIASGEIEGRPPMPEEQGKKSPPNRAVWCFPNDGCWDRPTFRGSH